MLSFPSPLSVPFKEQPKFNPRRRTSTASATSSGLGASILTSPRTRLESPLINNLRSAEKASNLLPASPSPSDRSLPPYSSGSSISGETTSTGSGSSYLLNGGVAAISEGAGQQLGLATPGSRAPIPPTGSMLTPRPLLGPPPQQLVPEEEHLDSASALAVSIANGKQCP